MDPVNEVSQVVTKAKEALGAQSAPQVVSPTPAAADPKADVDDATASIPLPPGAERNIRKGQAGFKNLPPQLFHLELAAEAHVEAGEGSRYRPIGKPALGQAVVRLDVILTVEKMKELIAAGQDLYLGTASPRVPTVIDGDHLKAVKNDAGQLVSFFGSNREQEQYQKGSNAALSRLRAAARAIDAAKSEKEGKTLGKDEVGKMEQALLNTVEAAGLSEYDTSRAYVRREVYGPIASDVNRFMNYYQEFISNEIAKLPAPSKGDSES